MEPSYKIVLYGDFGVGKTSLTKRLTMNTFEKISCSTIGTEFSRWTPEKYRDHKIPFDLWDTAGQERFNSLIPAYLRDADAVFYCWDFNVPFDKEKATQMLEKAFKSSPKCHFYMIFTRTDLDDYGDPFSLEAELWSQRESRVRGVFYTSALTGDGVAKLFLHTAKNIINDPPYPEKFAKKESIENKKRCCYS